MTKQSILQFAKIHSYLIYDVSFNKIGINFFCSVSYYRSSTIVAKGFESKNEQELYKEVYSFLNNLIGMRI